MTTEQINGYIAYWAQAKIQAEYEYYRTKDERYNDLYVLAIDMMACMELAKCQLYQNESRKKGAINND